MVRRNLGGGADVVMSGGLVAFDVVVGSADIGGLLDVDKGVASGQPLVSADALPLTQQRPRG
jgi:hypothetical protein